MATDTEGFILSYKYLFEDLPNPVTKNWFLVRNPAVIFSIITAYLLFCVKIGPWYMRNKRPYNLKNVIKIYNIVQILISLYLVERAAYRLIFTDFDLKCQNTGLDDPIFLAEATASYIYYISKITELLDTIFFVLRKSDRQITFLHLFHHTFMACVCWYAMLYQPGGNAIIMGAFNSLVHVFMYSYYLVASFGEKYKKILKWKKYITIMQLVQFVIVGLHSFNSFFYGYCGYPFHLKLLTLIQSILFFKMFWAFYRKAYWKNKANKKSLNGVHKNGSNKHH